MKHTVQILVNDEAGVMTKITGMFARRGFNIDTITVGKTHRKGISKIIFTLDADDRGVYQIEKQCAKLIDVLEVKDLPEKSSIFRELCLVKVKIKDVKAKKNVQAYAQKHRFPVIHTESKHVIIEMMAEPSKIDVFLKGLGKFGIIDISRTGIAGMRKNG